MADGRRHTALCDVVAPTRVTLVMSLVLLHEEVNAVCLVFCDAVTHSLYNEVPHEDRRSARVGYIASVSRRSGLLALRVNTFVCAIVPPSHCLSRLISTFYHHCVPLSCARGLSAAADHPLIHLHVGTRSTTVRIALVSMRG